MGYRSDVAIAVKDEYAEEFTKLIEEFGEPDKKVFTKDRFIKAVYFEECTWDDVDESVADIEEFLKKLDTDEFGMIIIGTDIYDIEYSGNPYKFNIGLKRSIEFNFADGA